MPTKMSQRETKTCKGTEQKQDGKKMLWGKMCSITLTVLLVDEIDFVCPGPPLNTVPCLPLPPVSPPPRLPLASAPLFATISLIHQPCAFPLLVCHLPVAIPATLSSGGTGKGTSGPWGMHI